MVLIYSDEIQIYVKYRYLISKKCFIQNKFLIVTNQKISQVRSNQILFFSEITNCVTG